MGQTSIDYPTTAFQSGRTGSGLVFPTASVEEIRRELLANAGRIEGWRKTAAYEQYRSAWSAQQRLQDGLRAIKNLDVNHVISRLRLAKRMPQEEAEAIYRNLDAAVHSDEQVVEVRFRSLDSRTLAVPIEVHLALLTQHGRAERAAALAFATSSRGPSACRIRPLPSIAGRSRPHCQDAQYPERACNRGQVRSGSQRFPSYGLQSACPGGGKSIQRRGRSGISITYAAQATAEQRYCSQQSTRLQREGWSITSCPDERLGACNALPSTSA